MNASWRQVLRGTASIDHTQANGPYSPRSLDVSGSRRGDFGQLNTPRSQHFMQASPRLNIGLNNDVKLHALSIEQNYIIWETFLVPFLICGSTQK